MGRLSTAELDAVTIDAYGTLVTLLDPVPELAAALTARGVTRERDVVVAGFRAEVTHYTAHSAEGHDEAGLARLQRECTRVFLDVVGAKLDAEEFAPVYAGAMHFEVLPGVVAALERLRSLGLEVAVVANWDLTLHRLLEEIGLTQYFRAAVHAAGKPAPEAPREGRQRIVRRLAFQPLELAGRLALAPCGHQRDAGAHPADGAPRIQLDRAQVRGQRPGSVAAQ